MNRSLHNLRKEIDRMVGRDIAVQQKKGSTRNNFGHYFEIINGLLMPFRDPDDDTAILAANKLPTQSLAALNMIYWGPTAKVPAWYVALWANEIAVPDNLTGANFVSTLGEITSETEGYSGTNRPQWTPNATTTGVIDNIGQEATFNIVATTTLNVEGASLMQAQARGATTGVAGSAARYPATRVLTNGDVYKVGYRNTHTS